MDRQVVEVSSLSLSFSFSDYLPTCLAIYLPLFLSIYLSIYPSIYLVKIYTTLFVIPVVYIQVYIQS